MPTNRRFRTRERHSPELTSAQKEYLLTGCYLARGEPFENAEVERQTWRENREALMAEWFTREPQLFCRPSAWWVHESPEGRRLLSGEVNLEEARDYFGIPSSQDAENYETHFSFLRRHPELLTGAEQQIVLSEATIRWRSLPASEMADEKYVLDHTELLGDDELTAFQEHLVATDITVSADPTIH